MTIMIKDTCKYAATEKYSPWKTNKVDKIVGHKQSNAEEGNHPWILSDLMVSRASKRPHKNKLISQGICMHATRMHSDYWKQRNP